MKNKFVSSLWGQSQNLTWQEEIKPLERLTDTKTSI